MNTSNTYNGGTFDLIETKVILGYLVHLGQNGLYLKIGWSYSEREWNLGLMETINIYGVPLIF